MLGLRLDCTPLITALRDWQFSQVSTHLDVHLNTHTRPARLQDVIRDNVKSLTKVETNNIHCSPLTHQASCLIVEGYQVNKARSPLCKSTPTTPNHLLVFNMFGNSFQDCFLHQLPILQWKLQ